MIGGALEDVSLGKKIFAVGAVSSALLLMISKQLLLSAKKNICTHKIYGGTASQIEKQLDAACGPITYLNTDDDYSYVIYFAGNLFTSIVWLTIAVVTMKQYFWDMLKRHTLRSIDMDLVIYAMFGMFGFIFLVLSNFFVTFRKGRTCQGVETKECKNQTYNDSLNGWLTVPIIVFGFLSIAPIWSIFSSRQYRE